MSQRWLVFLGLLVVIAASPAVAAAQPGPAQPPAAASAPAPIGSTAPPATSAVPPAASAAPPLASAAPSLAPAAPPAVPLARPEVEPTQPAAPLAPVANAVQVVRVVQDSGGARLQVDGRDTMVFGMNWGYSPVGTNYSYSLWTKPDAFIERVLHREMGLLHDMGVNAIRLFSDVPPRWVTWIYDHYGIYTALNHLMGRYGFDIDGAFVANIDYSNPAHRRAVLADLTRKVEAYRNTRGVLFWLLGNENNYGLSWTSFEIQALPGQEDAARAVSLYTLMGEAIAVVKARDSNHPVTLVNGDVQYLDLVAKHCKGLDAFGTNVYRGPSARDLFDKVKATLGLPVMFTEFGADAYDARDQREDHVAQAEYLRSQWEEIYEQSDGKGRAGNAIGGFIFQWDDGWWKVGQELNLDVHDTKATWPNEGYSKDFTPGENNMNEEWFGLVAKDRPDADGWYEVHPRSAYYMLKEAFKLDPYAADTTLTRIRAHFDQLHPRDFAGRYDAEEALARTAALGAVRVSSAYLKFETAVTGGNARTLRNGPIQFGHTESLFVDFAVQPSPRAQARISVNVIGSVADNKLDPIFYETRGKAPTPSPTTPLAPGAPAAAPVARDRLAFYQADFNVDQPWYNLEGYYRVGHANWADEGDFFGLYPEAQYGPNIDRYNGEAPFGAVLSGKKAFEGFKVAVGPQLYWGANPAVLVKYRRELGPVTATAMYEEDLAAASTINTSGVVPQPVARKATLHLGVNPGKLQIGLGGIFSSPQQVGRDYTYAVPLDGGGGYQNSGYAVLKNKVNWTDTLGAKAKIVYDSGVFRWYAEGQVRGLVANGGPDTAITLTKWTLKESGRGNQASGMAGVALRLGKIQIAPNFLYQKPFVGPMPVIGDKFDPASHTYLPGFVPRNVNDSPFVVLDNRETIAGELLVTFDPTPATWYGSWDREIREDAGIAGSVDFVYRHQPTTRDANLGFLANGQSFAFTATPPAHDAWDLTGTFVSNPAERWRISGSLLIGQGQARGEDARLITHYGGTLRIIYGKALFTSTLLLDDWGPYDYHRDFNLTYPVQWYEDLSIGLAPAGLALLTSRFGVRWQLRTLDAHSEGFVVDPANAHALGTEYEIGTYIQLGL